MGVGDIIYWGKFCVRTKWMIHNAEVNLKPCQTYMMERYMEMHCVKSVPSTEFFLVFISFIRTEYGDFQSEYRKIRTRKNSVFGQLLRSDT